MIIGVIGSGAMGKGIAQVAAAAGNNVILYDNNKLALANAKTDIKLALDKSVEKQKLTARAAAAIEKRITYAGKLTAMVDCELIIEAIIENLEVKQKLFSELEALVSSECILATNTSSFSVTSIASACINSKRVIGIHFFNPAPLMPLVELIPAITTAANVTASVQKIITGWNKTTVLAKDSPGFIVNRVVRSYYGESIRMYEEGIADHVTIDWALKEIGKFKMGPFELMDFIGNDINYKVTESVWEQFFYEPRFKPSLTQKRLVEARLFGRKSGKGYYDYADHAVKLKPNTDLKLATVIFNRVIAMLINEAADSIYLGLATKEDIDLAMIKGVNYPKGLLAWADEIGLHTILKTLTDLQLEYGEDRYRPSVLIKKMVKEGRKFY
jgi:3-hydroxybutyryl-CoA dehydrogenase